METCELCYVELDCCLVELSLVYAVIDSSLETKVCN